MSRDVPTGFNAAVEAATVYGIILVELHWPSGIARASNAYHVINWNGVDWQPTGHLGSLSDISETGDGTANGMKLTLSGLSPSAIAQAQENDSQGLPARVYFGVISATGFTIDPYCVFNGLIDFASIMIEAGSASVSISLEKELYDDRSNARRWNHEDQQIDFPGDLGFEFVASIASKQFTWGKATMAPANTEPVGDPNQNEY